MGLGWDGMGLGWKSLKALILRAPLCGANNSVIRVTFDHYYSINLHKSLMGKPVDEDVDAGG